MIVNVVDAMVTAQHLNAFIRHARSVRMANFTGMLTSMGVRLIRMDKPLLLDPNFYSFLLYSRTCGQMALEVFWSSDTFSANYLGRDYPGIRTLDVTATLDTVRKQVVVYVVNQSKEKPMETTITLAAGQFTGKAQVSVLNGPDIKSENTEEKPNEVNIKTADLEISGNSFTFLFEPHSITALVCGVS